ncbi:MAG TPA: hypothetical protein VES93_01015 [Ornithinibacter sp.]|nr:hypothetical protein [Ornithinibacter sp.]
MRSLLAGLGGGSGARWRCGLGDGLPPRASRALFVPLIAAGRASTSTGDPIPPASDGREGRLHVLGRPVSVRVDRT